MRKSDITKRMARRSGVTQAEAADRLDRLIHEIVSELRNGREASLPGLGRFSPGPDGRVAFRREEQRHG